MAITNVFMNDYVQPENRLTFNFLCVIEHLPQPQQCCLIAFILDGDPKEFGDNPIVEVETVMSGHPSNPDGTIRVHCEGNRTFRIYLENKTTRMALSANQLINHFTTWCKDKDDYVIAITPRPEDNLVVSAIGNDKIAFKSWGQIVNCLESMFLAKSTPFVVEQFLEYGRLTGEFEGMEISESDVSKFVIRTPEPIKNKYRNVLENAVREIDFRRRGIDVADLRFNNGKWGRFGFEMTFSKRQSDYDYRQWQFFGIYEESSDHGIEFKESQPELAYFLDVDKGGKQKAQLATNCAVRKELEELEREGFDQNLDNTLTSNVYRLLAHRTPLSKAPKDINGIKEHFERIVDRLLEKPELRNLLIGAAASLPGRP